MTFGNTIFPFNNCNYNELININSSDRYIPIDNPISNLPKHKITEQARRVSGLNSHDSECDINLSKLSGCENYSDIKFHKLISKKVKIKIMLTSFIIT